MHKRKTHIYTCTRCTRSVANAAKWLQSLLSNLLKLLCTHASHIVPAFTHRACRLFGGGLTNMRPSGPTFAKRRWMRLADYAKPPSSIIRTHTVQRACLFTPSMPSHTVHAFTHCACLHTPCMPSYTVHAFTHRPCLFTPSIPFHTTYAFPYVSLFTLCMPSQTVHALRFSSSSSSSGSSSPDYQNLIRAFTHTPSKSGSSPTV